jgi:Raf kinase inhibitor-like YbhB/YbcL family protein
MTFRLRSPAFEEGQRLPEKYTLDGENLSPPLEWSDAPEATKSFLLVAEDPDAPSGLFKHWAIYNIAPERGALPEGAGRTVKLDDLGWGVNDFGNAGYDGPKPPKGHGVHHYHFRLAALDVESLPTGSKASIDEVKQAASGHVLAEAELVGTYSR